MGEKPVTDLAGVGDILGKRLAEAGFDKVSEIEFYIFVIVFWGYVEIDELFWLFFFFNQILKAYTVLGQYLILKKDSELFREWMKDTCQANSKQAADCYQCLNDWCEEFL